MYPTQNPDLRGRMSGPFNIRRHRRRPSINITSLIDVMFLLLIFFMVSSSFRDRLGIDITLPEAQTASEHRLPVHEITVTEAGEFYFGEQRVDDDGLRRSLTRFLEEEPNAAIVLRADERADFGRAVRAIDIAREVGGNRLIVPTRPQGEPSP